MRYVIKCIVEGSPMYDKFVHKSDTGYTDDINEAAVYDSYKLASKKTVAFHEDVFKHPQDNDE